MVLARMLWQAKPCKLLEIAFFIYDNNVHVCYIYQLNRMMFYYSLGFVQTTVINCVSVIARRQGSNCTLNHTINESTTGADASVEALKLYHMKLTLAYNSLLAREYKKWEMIAVIFAKKSSKSTNGRARL